ncbi:MAG TPA: hypothetical protein VGK82_17175 [Pyrinomonadaceae bacterium]
MPDNVFVPDVDAIAPTNGKEATPLPPPASETSEVFALFKAETTVMVWLTFLIFGGGILALYYVRIRYLPDIEWSAALIYLGAATIIGGGVGLLFAMSLFLPGFIWSESLIFDPKLEKEFCYNTTTKELCVRSIFIKIGIPFGAGLLLSHASLVLGQFNYSLETVLIFYAGVSLICLIFAGWYVERNLRSPLPASRHKQNPTAEEKENGRRKYKCVSWFLLSLVLSQISVLTMYVLSKPKNSSSFVALTFICTAGVLISNHVVAFLYHHHSRQAIIASLVAAGFLLLTADWFSPLSLRIMGYYGLGDGRTVDLLVTEQGSKTVEALGFTPCRTRTLCNVEILSKLGDEYYLVAGGKTFTLPKTAVESYQSSDPRLAK